MWHILMITVGLCYGNFVEWFAHKNILHIKRLIKKTKLVAFHWSEHHKKCRQNGNFDDTIYLREIFALAALGLLHLPIVLYSKVLYLTLVYCMLNYYFKHRYAHLNVKWGKDNLPWHFDHHMGPDQNKNWGVTRPWFDLLCGTRVYYLGTVLYHRKERLKNRFDRRRGEQNRANRNKQTNYKK